MKTTKTQKPARRVPASYKDQPARASVSDPYKLVVDCYVIDQYGKVSSVVGARGAHLLKPDGGFLLRQKAWVL